MKNIILRLLSITLAALMLVSVTACGGDEENKDTSDGVVTSSGEGPVSRVPADLHYGGGEEVNILASKQYLEEFEPEEGSTAIIDSAVVKRNLLIQERLGIKLNMIWREEAISGPYQDVIRNMILGGDGVADIIQGNAYFTAKLASEGMFYNFNTEDEKNYVSPELDWYNQSFVKNTAYKNKLYFLVGDATIGATDRVPVIFFNEDLLAEWHIDEDIYDKAVNGKWTIEYMKTLIKNVYQEDDNVEGKTSGDIYGLYFNGGSMCIDAMISAVGINITNTDTNGDITMAWGTPNDVMGFQAIYKLMYETDGVFTGTVANKTYYGETSQYFAEDAFFDRRAVFATGMLCAAKNFALDPEIHFGMLPLPKMSEDDEYRTTPQDAFSVLTLPLNIGSRLEIATATMETLFEYSYKEVRPVYHDVAYKIRYASGANTALLFDTVINSIYYEFGTFYSNAIDNPTHKLRNKLTGTGTTLGSNLSSVTAQYGSAMKQNLKTLLETFDKNA